MSTVGMRLDASVLTRSSRFCLRELLSNRHAFVNDGRAVFYRYFSSYQWNLWKNSGVATFARGNRQ